MTSRSFIALLLAGTLLTGTFAGTADAAEPRREATVSGDQIRLGDLFDGLPADQADRVVANAPEPGKRSWFDSPTLASLAAAHGIDWKPAGGADRTVVVRASIEVPREEIVASLKRAMLEIGAPAGLELTLENRSLALFLPEGVEPTVAFRNVRYDETRNRVTADLVAPAEGPELVRQTIGARAQDMVEVPILNRRLGSGEVIGDQDIAWIKVPRDRVGTDVVTDLESLVGLAARRTLAASQPVRSRDVRTPVVVARGALVTLLLQTPAMTLTAQGKALADGGLGETVRIVNTTSNRIVDATVAGPDLVTVLPPAVTAARRIQSASN